MPKLSKEDAAAVDLLLDRSQSASGKAGAVYASTHGASRDRVRSVEKILSLFQQMPAADPPRNLLKKTLNRVGETLPATVSLAAPSLVGTSAQPHA